MSASEIAHFAGLVDDMFCRPGAPYGPFASDGDPVVLAEGLMARATIYRPDDESERYDLTLFKKIDGFAGTLWEQSARTLLRLRSTQHPGLPTIRMATRDEAAKVAFTLTTQRGNILDISDAVTWAHDHPLTAFEQFSILLDALKQLHGSRIMHRLLLPSAFRFDRSEDGGSTDVSLSLARFEMSALISNVIRRVAGGGGAEVRSTVQQLYLAGGDAEQDPVARARHLAYLAPEIHLYLFDERHKTRRDWDTTDVFGLGVLAWELFCGGLPQNLGPELDAVAASRDADLVRALADLHKGMRRVLSDHRDVPEELKAIVANMIAASPDDRKSSYDLAREVEEGWDAIRSAWEAKAAMPYLVAFMPAESAETLYNERQWISRSPVDAAGREELKAFYQRELAQAVLVHSLTGAEGYATGPPTSLKEAEWVLIGERAVWFCAYFHEYGISGQAKEIHENVLVVKYLREHRWARELLQAQPRRRIPAIDLVAFRPGQSLAANREDRPSWEPLTRSVALHTLRDWRNEEFLHSLDFLLDYQRAALDARTYPFVLHDQSGGVAVLRYDEERDDGWRQQTPLLAAYARDPRRRPAMGDFVKGLDTGEGWTQLQIDSRYDEPGFSGDRRTVQFRARRDADTIEVDVPHGTRLADAGWLRPQEDGGSRPQLARQLRGRQALQNQAALITALRKPRSAEIGRQHWQLEPDQSATLKGNAPGVIRDMLSQYPVYALQGPPGSGKTHSVANALRLYLKSEGGARVLVSAQSNFALDNIAERLIKTLGEDVLVLREVPEHSVHKVSTAIQRHTLTSLTTRVKDGVKATLGKRLAGKDEMESDDHPPLTDDERELVTEWKSCVESDQVELARRIKAGASVVLATCSGAATVLENQAQIKDTFDWVIVEEAAKAWPTEAVIPLTLGTRWTLIGDHRQLGAHRSEEVATFLESLRTHRDVKVNVHYAQRAKRLEVLNLFRTMFEPVVDDNEEALVDGAERPAPDPIAPERNDALGRLNRQFRMHSDIAQPVRRVFYPVEPPRWDADGLPESFLETDDSATAEHRVTAPGFLAGRALIWLDTEGSPRCEDQPVWWNEGEIELIDQVVTRMRPYPAAVDADGPDSLAVLTPYAEQRRRLDQRGSLRGRVHTVHSFQGREADRVLVSLVRTTRSGDGPSHNVGHVGRAEVVNVLLSRAKRMLVLVGRFAHFRENGGDTWKVVTDVVERYGTVVRAVEGLDQ